MGNGAKLAESVERLVDLISATPDRVRRRGSGSSPRPASAVGTPDHLQSARDSIQRAWREFDAKRQSLEQDVQRAKDALAAHLASDSEIKAAAKALGIQLPGLANTKK